MKKALKIVLWLFGAILALVIVAAIVLPMILDPNDFRDDIGNAVAKQTGRELQIDGDLELSVIPWLGVRVGPARLSNAPDFGDEPDPRTGLTGCEGVVPPDAKFQAHMAPLGITFWDGGAVIAFHGSWNRSEKVGYEVWWLPWDDGPAGEPNDVSAWHRGPHRSRRGLGLGLGAGPMAHL